MRRLANIALSLVMIACGILLMLEKQDGLMIVIVILGIGLMVYGVRKLVYFFTMARHMAGGLSLLFIAVLAIDAGGFALTLIDEPRTFIVLYLVGYNLLTGAIGIVRSLEAKGLESRWKPTMVHAAINLALAVACLVFIGSDSIIITIFCIGLFYAAVARLVSAFKPTEIIYIQ